LVKKLMAQHYLVDKYQLKASAIIQK